MRLDRAMGHGARDREGHKASEDGAAPGQRRSPDRAERQSARSGEHRAREQRGRQHNPGGEHDDRSGDAGKGYDANRRTFTQYYGSQELDAAVLMLPIVGFLPGTDERVTGTIDALRDELGHDGFISRYSTAATDDGLPGSEGQFLGCSFWLVTALALNARRDEARRLFERLLTLGNDLGLFSEEYDVSHQRLIGNFPQAFTHLTLIQAAKTLASPNADVAARYAEPAKEVEA